MTSFSLAPTPFLACGLQEECTEEAGQALGAEYPPDPEEPANKTDKKEVTTCTILCVRTSVYVYVYVCIYVCTNLYICMYMYTYDIGLWLPQPIVCHGLTCEALCDSPRTFVPLHWSSLIICCPAFNGRRCHEERWCEHFSSRSSIAQNPPYPPSYAGFGHSFFHFNVSLPSPSSVFLFFCHCYRPMRMRLQLPSQISSCC